jgi:peptide chain release factor subunit 1
MAQEASVLILTPIKDAVSCLETYFAGLRSLDYPSELLSLGLLEGDSTDGTFEKFQAGLKEFSSKFASARIWKKDFHFQIPPHKKRWDRSLQQARRSVLAKSRNFLLFSALQEHDWVLWLDVDVIDYPPDLIRRLLAAGKDIVQPHCVKEFGGPTFDRNAWRDHGRLCMDDLRAEGDLVALDAVGGTVLLVRADIHREGLIFPTFFLGRPIARARRDNLCHSRFDFLRAWRGDYQGEIETEGLGIMAHEMGYPCHGMPNFEVRHRDA